MSASEDPVFMDVGWDYVPKTAETEEMEKAFKTGGVKECANTLERMHDEWQNIPLDVAVIGNSGVGKSSFINAIRRLTADDEGAAEVGVTETTEKIRSYQHPNNPMLKFWDLPGVGTDKFPTKTYLKDVSVEKYDFFILITADRFTENDTWLGNEFRKRKKKFFFVRTKIEANISSDRDAHPKTHNADAVVKKIRQSSADHLKTNGCDIPVGLFLIDSYKLNKFDFGKLEQQLIDDFPELKRVALVLSLHATSEKMISVKVKELRSVIWRSAALAGTVTAIQVPGVAFVFDIFVVKKQSEFYYTQLGLDETSLERCATLNSVDRRQLKSIVNGHLGFFFGVEGINDLKFVEGIKNLKFVEGLKNTKFVEGLCKYFAGSKTSAVVTSVGSKCLPVIQMVAPYLAAPLSFTGTYYALKVILDKMESAALEVMKYAAENAANAGAGGSGHNTENGHS